MADPLTVALIEQLVRSGTLGADDIDDMAARLEAEGDTESARAARAAFVRASAPSQSEWEAQRRRARIRAVPDGGNEPL